MIPESEINIEDASDLVQGDEDAFQKGNNLPFHLDCCPRKLHLALIAS